MRAPMMRIHTVAAGGGSICSFDGARFRVGPGVGRRESRPGLVPPRRAADRHRLQCHGRQDRIRRCSPRYSGRPATCRSTPRWCASKFAALAQTWPMRPGDERTPEEIADGISATSPSTTWRNAIKQISVAARLRRDRIHAVLFRRRRRPACVRGRRRAGDDARVHPSARRRALRVRHGPGRRARVAPASGRGRARSARRCAAADATVRRDWPSGARRESRRRASPHRDRRCGARCISSTTGTDTTLEIPMPVAPGTHPDAATMAALAANSSANTGAHMAFSCATSALVIEAVAVEAIGDHGERRRSCRRSSRPRAGARCSRCARAGAFSPTARGARRRSIMREALLPGDVIAGSRGHRGEERHDGDRARLEGRG